MEEVIFRWWGNAGIELRAEGHTVMIDPLVTRPRFWQFWFGRVEPDREAIEAHLVDCDDILSTCTRWDHFLDIPELARRTRASVLGAERVCEALRAADIPPMQVRCVGPGDVLDLGPFRVLVLAAEHGGTPVIEWLDRRAGRARPSSEPDAELEGGEPVDCYGFHFRVQRMRLIVPGQELLPAHVLFLSPAMDPAQIQFWLAAVRPRLAIAIHWDDIFHPLSEPARPYLGRPRLRWPPLGRIDLEAFVAQVTEMSPGTQVLIPERFRSYRLTEILDAH